MSDEPLDGLGQPPHLGEVDDEAEFERLRELLLGREKRLIDSLLERLADPSHQAHAVGNVLPEAVVHSASSGPRLERALAPTMERATRQAIRSDTKAFADALFPVMGPAIRKAIAESLRAMVQSLNQALEHGLSIRGLKWRLEALRSGRSFGEVVLSHTLVYRVEQIFLIHRESGLLLQHVVAPAIVAQDADMVSGMLTAIQDFVRDSFGVDQGESLETMEVGDLQVWVEHGPRAVLAAAVRGNAPVELRQVMREALETIHAGCAHELATYAGESSPFEVHRPLLEECLRSKRVEAPARVSPMGWALLGVGLALLLWWAVSGFVFDRKLDRFLAAMRAEPGLLVSEVERHHGSAVVRGLRDPLARDPSSLVQAAGLGSDAVRLELRAFQALDDSLVLARARQLLDPPPGVELACTAGTLTVSGTAGTEWRNRARLLGPVVAGVVAFDDTALAESTEDSETLRARLEAQVVTFEVGSAVISPEQQRSLASAAEDIIALLQLTDSRFQLARVWVEGYADPSGTAEVNVRLSRDRAQGVVRFLTDRGVPASQIQAVGKGALAIPSTAGEDDLPSLRRVAFAVAVRSVDAGGSGR